MSEHEFNPEDAEVKAVALHGGNAAGRVAVVDAEDYELVAQYRWFADESYPGKTYATAHVGNRASRFTSVRMHKLITGWPETDHEDNDGLNNRRSNLRDVTRGQNNANQSKQRRLTSSRYKGVCWHRRGRKWAAYIKAHGKRHHLGLFVSEEDAARAYDAAADSIFGEFARFNFPRQEAKHDR